MAVLKNGKLVGRVGNLVYRHVKGRTIVQSRPRPPKGGFKLTSRNSDFAIASKVASGLYRELKDFALNQTTRDLYNSMIGLLMDNPQALQPEDGEGNWSIIPDSHLLPVEKKSSLNALLDGEIISEITYGNCRLMIPGLRWPEGDGSKHRVWKDVSAVELTYTLLHYDLETASAAYLKRWTSGRLSKKNMQEPMVLDCEILDLEDQIIDSGLLLLSVGVKLYASQTSDTYLNQQDFNPFAVIGVWRK